MSPDTQSAPAADQLSGSGGAGDPGEDEQSEPKVHIPSNYLPQGIKEGDTLLCTGMDEEGALFELEAASDDDQGDDQSWESDFRKDMSPRNPQSQAM